MKGAHMLLDFSVGNFRSFKEIVTFSMVASSISELDETHTINGKNAPKGLKSAAIYGANASGKSNIIAALGFVRSFVINSAKESQVLEKISVEPFRLNDQTAKQPSFFQVNFICDGTQYRYGFEVDADIIHSEWLFSKVLKSPGPEATLFRRSNQKITLGSKFKEGEGLQTKTRPNALFISTVALFNGEIAGRVVQWFSSYNVIVGTRDSDYLEYTAREYLNNPDFQETFLRLLKVADLGIETVSIEERQLGAQDIPAVFSADLTRELTGRKIFGIKTGHKLYNDRGESKEAVEFDLLSNESEGTQKMFSFAGPIIDTLKNGKILFIDEFDAKLHPALAEAILEIFNSTKSNPKNAQLVFATHTTHFLNKDLLRRDQIWFTNKDRFGATSLYSLVEYRDDSNLKVRPDASFEKNYYLGRYRATPNVGSLSDIFSEAQ